MIAVTMCPHGVDLRYAKCLMCDDPAFHAAQQSPANTQTVMIGGAAPRINFVALDTIRRTIQEWLDWQERERPHVTNDVHVMRVPEWPSRGVLKAWVDALAAASAVPETPILLSSNQHFGLTREQLQKLAGETVREHALHLVAVLQGGDYDGMNLVALLEIFAGKLAEASAPDIPAAPAMGICCYGGRRTRSQCGSCAAWKPDNETSDEPSVMGAGCGIAPMPTPSEGIDAAVRLIQKICAEYNLDPAQWLHGEKIEALITERDEAVALAAIWHESCTGKHGSQAPCVSPPKTSRDETGSPT